MNKANTNPSTEPAEVDLAALRQALIEQVPLSERYSMLARPMSMPALLRAVVNAAADNPRAPLHVRELGANVEVMQKMPFSELAARLTDPKLMAEIPLPDAAMRENAVHSRANLHGTDNFDAQQASRLQSFIKTGALKIK